MFTKKTVFILILAVIFASSAAFAQPTEEQAERAQRDKELVLFAGLISGMDPDILEGVAGIGDILPAPGPDEELSGPVVTAGETDEGTTITVGTPSGDPIVSVSEKGDPPPISQEEGGDFLEAFFEGVERDQGVTLVRGATVTENDDDTVTIDWDDGSSETMTQTEFNRRLCLPFFSSPKQRARYLGAGLEYKEDSPRSRMRLVPGTGLTYEELRRLAHGMVIRFGDRGMDAGNFFEPFNRDPAVEEIEELEPTFTEEAERKRETTFTEDAADEWLNFETVEGRHYKADVGVLYRRNEDGTVGVEVASMATGEGSEFRKWEVTDTKLIVGSDSVRPVKFDRIYGTQESLFAKPATVVFTAIGAAYGLYGDECSSGGTCPVTGRPAGGHPEKGDIARGIDTAGMAAGLGLLTSQAKGEVTGQKAVFKLDAEQADKIKGVRITAEHKGTSKKKRLTVPVKGAPKGLFSGSQTLSDSDLNTTRDYLEAQDRRTRPASLTGGGIISGLEHRGSVTAPSAQESAGKGTTSAGHQIDVKER